MAGRINMADISCTENYPTSYNHFCLTEIFSNLSQLHDNLVLLNNHAGPSSHMCRVKKEEF